MDGCPDNQAKKLLGNGWTVDVIAHIFSFIPKVVKDDDIQDSRS